MSKFNIIINTNKSEYRLNTQFNRIEAERFDEFLKSIVGASNVYIVPTYKEEHISAPWCMVTYSNGFRVNATRISWSDSDLLRKALGMSYELDGKLSRNEQSKTMVPLIMLHNYKGAVEKAYSNHKRIQCRGGNIEDMNYNFRANSGFGDTMHRVL